MKKQILLNIALFLLTAFTVQAQKVTLPEVLDLLYDMEVFVKNRKLKKDVLTTMNTIKENEQLTPQEYLALKESYEHLAFTFNDVYLANIKADLSNFKEIKKMLKRPNDYASNYADSYRLVVQQYNQDFTPLTADIHREDYVY